MKSFLADVENKESTSRSLQAGIETLRLALRIKDQLNVC
jgi:hypothetical protein